MHARRPAVRIVSAALDDHLDDRKFIIPDPDPRGAASP